MRSPAWLTALVVSLPILGGCGGGGGASRPPPAVAPEPAAPPVGPPLRWDPDEHSDLARARDWHQGDAWQVDLARLLADRDPGGASLAVPLARTPEPRRTELCGELLDYYERARHPDLAALLARFPVPVARVLGERLGARPEASLRLASRFLFRGEEPVAEAWQVAMLRGGVARLAKRTGFDVTDIQTGPTRVWALRLAGRARLKEAVEAIREAAGYARDEHGRRIAADPYGPAVDMALAIMRRERERQRGP